MRFQTIALWVCLLVVASCAWAQITTGSISGTVTDPAGAVVVGAKVQVLNQNTGVAADLTTNEAGLYKASYLTPGRYTVRIQAQGFRSAESKDVEVLLGRDSVVNTTLTVGAVTETVQVEASVPLIETNTSQLSLNISDKKVLSLPGVQAGGVDRLALLSPGIVYGFGNINSNGLVFSANGQRARSNNFLLDGQDNNDPSIGGPGYFFSNIESIGEFQVITNQFSAEYGRNAGAIVNIRVRSGTNDYHGSVSYFRRDDQNWTALTNFQRRTSITNPPKYLDSTFAYQVGGRIIRDRLFFNAWTQREWIRSDSLSIGTASALTPTPAGLTALQAAFPNSVPVKNLATYGPWAIKFGSPSVVSSTVRTMNLTGPTGATVPIEFGAVQRTWSQPQDNWDGGIKIDYRASNKDLVTGKYYQQDNTFANAASNAQAGYFYDNPGRSKQVGGSWVRTISPTLVNEFRFSFIKTGFFFEGGTTFPFSQLTKNIANVTISGGFLGYGLATNLPQYRLVNSYQFQDNVSKQYGRHSLKMGVQIIKDNIPLGFLPTVNGQFQFTSFQNYVNNTPSAFNGAAGVATQEPKEVDQAYYFQDDFKLRSNLTLNLGLRYEYSGQPINLLNEYTTARESNPSTAIWDTTLPLSDRTYPTLPAPSKNFAPRLGFAWTPAKQGGFLGRLLGNNATVFRGGFSMSYDPSFYNLMLNAQTAAPVVSLYTLTTNNLMPADLTGGSLQTLFAPPKGVDPRALNQTRFSPSFTAPYSEQFTFGVQRLLGNKTGFEIRYVGTRAVHQFATRNGNPRIAGFTSNGFGAFVPSGLTPNATGCANCIGRIIPNYGLIRVRDNSADSNYHGLQTHLDARDLLNQFTLSLSYTYSKTIDNISEVFGFLGSGSIFIAQNPFNVGKGERGLSNNNIPHAFSMGLTWEEPWLKHNSKWYGRLAGGWSLSVLDIWQAGRPMTVLQQSTTANTISDTGFNGGFTGSESLRPFLSNPGAPLATVGGFNTAGQLVLMNGTAFTTTTVQPSDVHWIYNNLAADNAYKTPFGVSRNSLTGPVFQRADIAVYKSFSLKKRENSDISLQFRGEATNAFNHPAYGVPNLYVDSGTTTTFLNPTETEVTPRRIRMGVRINF